LLEALEELFEFIFRSVFDYVIFDLKIIKRIRNPLFKILVVRTAKHFGRFLG